MSYLPLSVSLTGSSTAERISMVAAALAVPVAGVNGVRRALQRYGPAADGFVNTLVRLSVASNSLMPKPARPGVPAGTSGGPRQSCSLYEANAVSPPTAASTKIGTWIDCPPADRFSKR